MADSMRFPDVLTIDISKANKMGLNVNIGVFRQPTYDFVTVFASMYSIEHGVTCSASETSGGSSGIDTLDLQRTLDGAIRKMRAEIAGRLALIATNFAGGHLVQES